MYINGSTICYVIFDFSFGCSSNSSVQCTYRGLIVCVVLVANVFTVQWCESVWILVIVVYQDDATSC